MPSKNRPEDWNLFSPKAPRRGGPFTALGQVLLVLVVFSLLGAGGVYVTRYREQQTASVSATVTAFAPTREALINATAEVRTGQTATLEAATAQLAAEAIGSGAVTGNGELFGDPINREVVGQVVPGDQILFLEERLVGGVPWFRIRITEASAERSDGAAANDAEGWVEGIILSQPTPVAVP
ncbi:MAG: hypothetical protein GFH27_549333n78 [Chloroflexi bacterium AL-W]|nr:hypothetical protein [Chloroflexi bacterium AL-N1]NOK70469.1 hypothetical protein [Chloroflexi bacterium AL-N10]NOK78172.1 hypothetical protein [Chloroflexi bacterium AL-N5]NOK85271.1 hypothetical protein [Chloroflexi bacterium AL-W]NOK92036.1 hypothetical protein [Chloroflexi bacterium AL-N15]